MPDLETLLLRADQLDRGLAPIAGVELAFERSGIDVLDDFGSASKGVPVYRSRFEWPRIESVWVEDDDVAEDGAERRRLGIPRGHARQAILGCRFHLLSRDSGLHSFHVLHLDRLQMVHYLAPASGWLARDPLPVAQTA